MGVTCRRNQGLRHVAFVATASGTRRRSIRWPPRPATGCREAATTTTGDDGLFGAAESAVRCGASARGAARDRRWAPGSGKGSEEGARYRRRRSSGDLCRRTARTCPAPKRPRPNPPPKPAVQPDAAGVLSEMVRAVTAPVLSVCADRGGAEARLSGSPSWRSRSRCTWSRTWSSRLPWSAGAAAVPLVLLTTNSRCRPSHGSESCAAEPANPPPNPPRPAHDSAAPTAGRTVGRRVAAEVPVAARAATGRRGDVTRSRSSPSAGARLARALGRRSVSMWARRRLR